MKVPFRNLLVFPNQAPWPGRLREMNPAESLDAGRARELRKNAPSQPHSLGSLFIAEVSGFVQHKVYRGNRFTKLIPPKESVGLLLSPLPGAGSSSGRVPTACAPSASLRAGCGLHSFAPSELGFLLEGGFFAGLSSAVVLDSRIETPLRPFCDIGHRL